MNRTIPKKLLDNIYHSTSIGVFANIVLAFLCVLVYWRTRTDLVLGWFMALVAVMIYRIVLYQLYINDKLDRLKAFWLYYIGVIASAVVWVSLLWLSYDDPSRVHHFLIIFILVGITTAAMVSFSAVMLFYVSYALIFTIGVAGWLLSKEEPIYIWMVVATFIYFIFLIISAKRLHDLLLHSLVLDEERKAALEELKLSNERLRRILNNVPVGIFFYDRDLNIKKVNDYLVQLLGVTKEQFLALNLEKLKNKRVRKALRDVIHKGKRGVYEGPYQSVLSGKEVDVRLLTSPVYDEHGNIVGGLGVVEDIGEEIAYKKTMERFAQFYLKNPNPVFQIDCKSKRIVIENESSSIIRRFYDDWENLIERICTWSSDRLEVKIQNKIYELELVRLDDGIVNVYAQDMTAEIEARQRADFYAYYDELTELPRRKLFNEFVKNAMQRAKRYKRANALLFIDVDDFKKINDTFGHSMGDRYLKILANRLKHALRKSDIIARLGGDEFAVLLSDLSGDIDEAKRDAAAIAAKILEVIKSPVYIDNLKFETSASIGVVVFFECDLEELFKDADIAMYEAKSLGKDRIFVFDEMLRKKIVTKNILIDQLNRAITLEEFEVFLQPQVRLEDESLASAEALLRWHHPQEGLIYPADFIYLAEESGTIVDIDLWVMRRAYEFIEKCEELAYIAVNVSIKSFLNPRFHNTLEELVREGRIDPTKVEIELTESLIIEDYFAADSQIKNLKELGFRFAIDDFGTGYSSLSYIKHLSIDTLKIDRVFIKDLGVHKSGEVLTRIILEIAKNFDMQAVAEGVENEAQLSFLKELGCDLVQGYLFAKPMPMDEFAKFVKNYRR